MKTWNLGGLIIEEHVSEPCYSLSQYGKGLPITCQCSVCKEKNQTPEEAKRRMDIIYAKYK